MRPYKWVNLLALAALVLGMLAAPPSGRPVAASQADGLDKVEALVLQELAEKGKTDFIVWMKEKADLSPAYQLKTKAEKGQFVYETLRATAERTQAELRGYLDAQGVTYQSFYIANKIFIQGGDQSLLGAIAARDDVAKITANHKFQLQEPFKGTPPEQRTETVEPNISFIKADQVWAMGITGENTVLAGNDTGLDETHPAIAPHYRGCLNPPSCTLWDHNYNWWDAWDWAPYDPADDYGHGTHTTGTMVGDDGGANQIGVAPGAKTIHCKNMSGGGGDDAHFIECFEWDLAPWDLSGQNPRPDLAPDAINNSWGYWGGNQPAFEDEIAALQAAGIAVEVSAGNEGSGCYSLRSPGDYSQVLTTGSVNHAYAFPGMLTGFSSRGPSYLHPNDRAIPDIMAPGENVRSALPGNSYAYWSGTSMAGPHATALVGLIWSANPALRGQVDTTYQIIADTAARLVGQGGSNCGGDYVNGPNNDWGYGTIDAYQAVLLAIAMGGAGTLEGTVTDATTGLPVEGATVTAVHDQGFTWQDVTDSGGFYQMTVAAGTFEVTARHPHYQPETVMGVVVVEDGTTVQDFALTPRGWAYGYVTDYDNLTPIEGATVTAEDGSMAETNASGYYELWLDPGTHTLTAAAQNYAPETAGVTIVSGQGTQQDFQLQAAVVFIPSPIEVSVPLGNTHTEPATILNRQPWDYPFEFREKDVGYIPLLKGEPTTVKVPAGPAAAPEKTAVAAGPYQPRPEGTVTIPQGRGINQANVLLLAADDDNGGYSPIQQMLLAYGDLGAVDLYDPRYSTPDLSLLLNYNVVVVWSNYQFADSYGIGNVLADYVDAGGKVIDMMFALDPYWGYQGRFRTEGYTAMTLSGTSYTSSCLGSYDPSHPIMAGVTTLCEMYYRGYGTALTADSYEVARWQDNELLVAAKENQTVVTINDYPGIYYQWTGQLNDILHNAINWLAVPADVPWLAEDPAAGTVPAEGSLPVNILFDASPAAGVTQPGTYRAELTVDGDPRVKVPVEMMVEAPPSWGRLEGTVIGLGYCDQNPAPLKKAQVVITGASGASWTLETDAAGHYAIWLDSAENPLTIDVTYPGHQAGHATGVMIIPGGNIVVNFDLRWLVPCMSVDPLALEAWLGLGETEVQQVTLTNAGAGDANFEMQEVDQGYVIPMRKGFLPPAVRPANPDKGETSIGRAPNAPTASPDAIGKAVARMVGEPAYAVDVYPGYNLVYFTNDDPNPWTVIAPLPGNAYFAGDFINGDFSTLYVIDYYTQALYRVDTTTGVATYVGPSTPYGGESWTGMTGSVDGTMYASSTNISRSTLYTVDLSTGAVTVVGQITNAPAIIDIAITPSGEMYGVDIVNDNLVQIDPATGAGTVIGYIGFNANYAQGMDFEEESGTLYLAAFNNDTFQGELRIADPATGNSVLVEAFPSGAEVDSMGFATGGGGDVAWLSEDPVSGTIPGTLGPQGAPIRPAATGKPAANPGLSTSSPAPAALVAPEAPGDPDTVLWDQPLSVVNQNAYVDQEFSDYPAYSSFLADDFVNDVAWSIDTIFVPGNLWNGGTTLFNATALNWAIYADNAGVPDGDPSGRGNPPVWSLSLPPTDPQVTITNGSGGYPSNTTLALAAPVILPPGHYWLVFYPTMGFGCCGQYGRQPADTTNGYFGQFVNPGGGFGYGTEWQNWTEIGATQQDIAFRLEGSIAQNSVVVDVTFDAGMVAQPGDYFADLKVKSNDPVNKSINIDVTMHVSAPPTWGRLEGTVIGLGYCDQNPAPLKKALVQVVGGLTVETDANGHYVIWLEEGTYDVVVTADGHITGYATVVIVAQGTTVQDFALRWLQPCMSETPPSLEVTLDMGETAVEQITLTNDGAAEGTYEVSDSDQGYMPEAQPPAPVVPVGEPVKPKGASSEDVTVQPFEARLRQAPILHITTTDTSQSVQRALNELGYLYDLYYDYSGDWTGIDFSPYDTVIVGMDGGTITAASIQKVRTDVLDQGKKLIFLGGTCWQEFAMGVNDYLVLNDVNNYCWQVTNSPQWTLVDPAHPLAEGLPDSYNYANYYAGYYQIRVTDPEIEPVAINGEGWPAFFRKMFDGSFIWYIDSVYSYYWNDPNDFAFLKQLISNSIEVVGGGDALWLSEDPMAGTVAPDGGTAVIDVTFDAGMVTQPGVYMAAVRVKTNDPVVKRFAIPATMNVNGPPDWGRLEGVVSGLGYCDENPAPLKKALVEIVGGLTLETDANGHYSIWLEQGTYTLNVSAAGHVGDSAQVVIVPQQTITQDFDLRSIQPCISLTPPSFEVWLTPGTTKTHTLTLINAGAGASEFKIREMSPSFGAVEPPAGAQTSKAPEGYKPELTQSQFKGWRAKGGTVAIFKDANPWGSVATETFLAANGIPYEVHGSAEFGTLDFSNYGMIVFSGDQPTSFYDAYGDYVWKFEEYVEQGGFLNFFSCDAGWNGGILTDPLPGGMVWTGWVYEQYNVIDDPAHPVVQGVPSPFYGNYASHGHFSNLPADAHVIAHEQIGLQPTIVEYPLGAGWFIAFGQPLEISYDWGWDAGIIFGNTLLWGYAFEPQADIPWLVEDPVTGTVGADSTAQVAVTFVVTPGMELGDYGAILAVRTGDAMHGRIDVPVTLHVVESLQMWLPLVFRNWP